MKSKILIAAIFLAMAIPAAAEITLLQQGYEVALGNLRLPRTETGTIAFKECAECPYITKRVTADTQWILNGKRTSLKKFREGVKMVPTDKKRHATVLHHLEADRITKVRLYVR